MQQKDTEKYLKLLSEKYPSIPAVCTELINLNAILNLPKGTEHFMSDLHGEYEAFLHILNNCSGVIREKVMLLYKDTLTAGEIRALCTLIYYPREKLKLQKTRGQATEQWYRMILGRLIELAKLLSSKYTRSKVRKAMPSEFAYILDELIHVQKDEDDNQERYHTEIINTILDLDITDDFIEALSTLIKRLAVDHLHIVGDIYDRGADADKIMDLLMKHHSLDLEWGNHDILWMGAACGNYACVATCVRHSLRYHSVEMLEGGYGISLRELTLFAEKTYSDEDPMKAAIRAITIILFKLEGQLITDHPEYRMENRLLLDKMNLEEGTVTIDGGRKYALNTTEFPTVDSENPYKLTDEEFEVIEQIRQAFLHSKRLREHVEFMYRKGSMYRIFNGNLIYHGCIPMDSQGNFKGIELGGQRYQGKALMDEVDALARRAFYNHKDRDAIDFMWYLWIGPLSPLSGRVVRTFERAFIDDKEAWAEEDNSYYRYHEQEKYCAMILHEFGLYEKNSHIINGHTPVKTKEGELPVRAEGKLLVIDGGFCRGYQKKTGIAGYTLIFNSHGLRIKSHRPFSSILEVLGENRDIESDSQVVEEARQRIMVRDTDIGKRLQGEIEDLEELLRAYREGAGI